MPPLIKFNNNSYSSQIQVNLKLKTLNGNLHTIDSENNINCNLQDKSKVLHNFQTIHSIGSIYLFRILKFLFI